MTIIYTLSDNTITKVRPNFFYEREKMVERAKEIEANLKFTKKLSEEELLYAWLNDGLVKEYRELLREIWGFQQKIFIVNEQVCCDYCQKEVEGLLKVEYISTWMKDGFIFDDVLCQKCLKEKQDFWGKDRIYTVIGNLE